MDISTRGIRAAASLQASKAPAEDSWTKRGAGARERLQPIRADATCAVTHDNNNNSLKSVETGAEKKSAVQQLTKIISSGNGNFKAKKIIPETILEAHQSYFMQEMAVKYN